MSSISWTETTPSDTSNASVADEEFRSMVTAISIGLGESMYWPGSAASQGASTASSGELQLGASRLAITAGTPVGGHPDGFLGVDENNERLWHVGSVVTEVLAGGRMQDRNGGLDSAPFIARWLVQTDVTGLQASDRTVEVTFPTMYNGVPTVDIGPGTRAASWDYALRTVTASGFTLLKNFNDSGTSPTTRFMWRSEGTVNL